MTMVDLQYLFCRLRLGALHTCHIASLPYVTPANLRMQAHVIGRRCASVSSIIDLRCLLHSRRARA